MVHIRPERDPRACTELWQKFIPPEKLSDLWEFRECFHKHYKRELFFLVAEENGETIGFLPLSYIPEKECYGYFPGEVWKGTTWLEQNRIIARDRAVFESMLGWLEERKLKYHLRYLNNASFFSNEKASVDEIGYLFHPAQYQNDIEKYYSTFLGKTIKSIKEEIQFFERCNMTYRFNETADFDQLVQQNLDQFEDASYFADKRFIEAFRDSMLFIKKQGWLHMTTILIHNEPAAIDLGCVYNNVYTLLGGGTHIGFTGIAKVINLFHMKKACQQKYAEVDFLCGDFTWKKLFRLTQRPLYLVSNLPKEAFQFSH